MDMHKRHVAEGWHDKALNYLTAAQSYLQGRVYHSDAVQQAQYCVELSIKAVLAFLDVSFKKVHGWDRDGLESIAKQIRDRNLLEKLEKISVHIGLPRLIFLANFWDQFYLQAKYGMEAGYLASPQDLFTHDEAEIAVKHANECYHAANQVRFLPAEQAETLVKC
jgi:HEPN domain-containing protein